MNSKMDIFSIFHILIYNLDLDILSPLYRIRIIREYLNNIDFLDFLRVRHRLPSKTCKITQTFPNIIKLFHKYYSTLKWRDSLKDLDSLDLAIDNHDLEKFKNLLKIHYDMKTGIARHNSHSNAYEYVDGKFNRVGETGFKEGIIYLLNNCKNIGTYLISEGLLRCGRLDLSEKYASYRNHQLPYFLAHCLEAGKTFPSTKLETTNIMRIARENDNYALFHWVISNSDYSYTDKNIKECSRFLARLGDNPVDFEIREHLLNANMDIRVRELLKSTIDHDLDLDLSFFKS